MLRRLYDWTMGLASHRHSMAALFGVSFIESSFFPIPPDVLMIPMILAQRAKAFLIATVALVGSILGALLGYAIGALLMDSVGDWLLNVYGAQGQFADLAARFNENGIWVILFAGITPFPYKVITIFAGATGMSIPVFIISSIFARGIRFYIVAGLLWQFGPPIRDFIERRLGLVFTIFMVGLIGGFAALRFV